MPNQVKIVLSGMSPSQLCLVRIAIGQDNVPGRYWQEMTTRDFADSDTSAWIAALPVAASHLSPRRTDTHRRGWCGGRTAADTCR
jgi:hypothetical protein